MSERNFGTVELPEDKVNEPAPAELLEAEALLVQDILDNRGALFREKKLSNSTIGKSRRAMIELPDSGTILVSEEIGDLSHKVTVARVYLGETSRWSWQTSGLGQQDYEKWSWLPPELALVDPKPDSEPTLHHFVGHGITNGIHKKIHEAIDDAMQTIHEEEDRFRELSLEENG